MVKLPDSFRVFIFEAGLDRVRDAYRASMIAMQAEAKRASDELLAHVRSGEVGDEEYEIDDEGNRYLVSSTEHELSYRATQTGMAVSVVREAYITSAFHFWERSAKGWIGQSDEWHNFPKLKGIAGKNYVLHPGLDKLNILNNLIKHEQTGLVFDLMQAWPEAFSVLPQSIVQTKRLHWRIRITDAIVEEAFLIVRGSSSLIDDPQHR